MPRAGKVYVVTHPPAIRGVYETWAACEAAVRGVRGARYQAVAGRAEAEAMLSGEGRALGPGRWAFVDGNHAGGVGVVLVEQHAGGGRDVREVATTVADVFARAGVPALADRAAVMRELARLRNVLAELAGLRAALELVVPGSPVTVVHDYEGVGAWVEGRWRAKDVVVREIVDACRALAHDRRLAVSFMHQPGHRSTWAGRDDFAAFNARADALAAAAARG
jgi:ribonuclease H-related protein